MKKMHIVKISALVSASLALSACGYIHKSSAPQAASLPSKAQAPAVVKKHTPKEASIKAVAPKEAGAPKTAGASNITASGSASGSSTAWAGPWSSSKDAMVGINKYAEENFKDLVFNGSLDLYDTKVSNDFLFKGIVSLNNVSLNKVVVQGVVNLVSSSVAGPMVVLGKVTATDAQLKKDMAIEGDAEFNRSKMSGPVIINGGVKVENSIFTATFTSNDPDTVFSNSSFANMTFNAKKGTQIVNLKNTSVTGDINFVGEHGQVLMDGKSRIKGRVINGSVQTIGTIPTGTIKG